MIVPPDILLPQAIKIITPRLTLSDLEEGDLPRLEAIGKRAKGDPWQNKAFRSIVGIPKDFINFAIYGQTLRPRRNHWFGIRLNHVLEAGNPADPDLVGVFQLNIYYPTRKRVTSAILLDRAVQGRHLSDEAYLGACLTAFGLNIEDMTRSIGRDNQFSIKNALSIGYRQSDTGHYRLYPQNLREHAPTVMPKLTQCWHEEGIVVANEAELLSRRPQEWQGSIARCGAEIARAVQYPDDPSQGVARCEPFAPLAANEMA